MNNTTIAIIGAGAVGTTTAYALIMKNIPADIILIDINETRCAGEIMDLSDAIPLCSGNTTIATGTVTDAQKADIIIIAAGKRQEVGQSRADLVAANKTMLSTLMTQMKPLKQTALIIMVTNPVDILTYHAQHWSGLPHTQVFGTGTFLDSVRVKELLAEKLQARMSSINASIIGEHGDHQLPAWSATEIDGKSLKSFPQITEQYLLKIAEKTKNKVYDIIACKGSTSYGIATCIARICQTIIFDEKQIIPLSCFIESFGVYVSMPTVLGRSGIEKIIALSLNDHEQQQLNYCAQEIKKAL